MEAKMFLAENAGSFGTVSPVLENSAEPESPPCGGEEEDDTYFSGANLKWILESIEQGKQGKYIVKTLEELEAMTNG